MVRPRSAAEAQAVVRCCIAAGTPLVPRGAGTGLSGGANAIDGCVIVSLEQMAEIAARHDTHIANIAHIGDGNLHPLLVTPAGDEAARVRAQRAFDDIIDAALALGGTVTGEHGVGILKLKGLARELSAPVREMHRAVKQALDPHGIFNPGKVVPPRTTT